MLTSQAFADTVHSTLLRCTIKLNLKKKTTGINYIQDCEFFSDLHTSQCVRLGAKIKKYIYINKLKILKNTLRMGDMAVLNFVILYTHPGFLTNNLSLSEAFMDGMNIIGVIHNF